MSSSSAIISTLKLTASLMELHEENTFKVRAYQNAAISIDKTPYDMASLSDAELSAIPGLGSSMAQKIREICNTGTLQELEALLKITPAGLIELFSISGLGPKKIRTLWKDLHIESPQQLLEACNNNSIAAQKGFGEKTQESIRKALLFQLEQGKKLLISEAQVKGLEILQHLQRALPQHTISWCGDLYQQAETVETLAFIIATKNPIEDLAIIQQQLKADWDIKRSTPFILRGNDAASGTPLLIRTANPDAFESTRLIFSADPKHLQHAVTDGKSFLDLCKQHASSTEEAIYATAQTPFIPAECRVGHVEWSLAKEDKIKNLITFKDLKGIFHNHSTYSDGVHSVKEMAEACIQQGWEYFGIADHSQTAFYANGLKEDRVLQQFEEIDGLNKQLAPFKIFKGIESDILNDGALDYEDALLKQFDYVVASIHANLKMDQDKAMSRLIKAIENPYTTMLGHMTGRLLLRREGYPLDVNKIIDACAYNQVIIELNANPYRLDIDWRHLDYALHKGVLISINPDAHEQDGILDTHFGVIAGRKGGLLKSATFNTFSLEGIQKHFSNKKK
jgi:DNA polymerase (family X)